MFETETVGPFLVQKIKWGGRRGGWRGLAPLATRWLGPWYVSVFVAFVMFPIVISATKINTNILFLYPLKTSENQSFSDVF